MKRRYFTYMCIKLRTRKSNGDILAMCEHHCMKACTKQRKSNSILKQERPMVKHKDSLPTMIPILTMRSYFVSLSHISQDCFLMYIIPTQYDLVYRTKKQKRLEFSPNKLTWFNFAFQVVEFVKKILVYCMYLSKIRCKRGKR